jgi:hypothetical protein
MEEKCVPAKGKEVVVWLRCGCIFLKKAEVGYDFAKEGRDSEVSRTSSFPI